MSRIFTIVLTAMILLVSGCTLITEVDRNLVHHDAGAAGTGGSSK